MGLFGSRKIQVSPNSFVTDQLDKIFSDDFAKRESEKLARLSKEIHILQNLSLDKYIEERQRVIYNLLQIAWDRTIPYAIFLEHCRIMADDSRVESLDNGIYNRSLSRAQEAGMDTFGFISQLFVDQIASQDFEPSDSDHSKLCRIYKMEFTELYISFEKLIKKHKFIR